MRVFPIAPNHARNDINIFQGHKLYCCFKLPHVITRPGIDLRCHRASEIRPIRIHSQTFCVIFPTINDTLILCSANTATDTTTVMPVQNLFLLMVLTCNGGGPR